MLREQTMGPSEEDLVDRQRRAEEGKLVTDHSESTHIIEAGSFTHVLSRAPLPTKCLPVYPTPRT